MLCSPRCRSSLGPKSCPVWPVCPQFARRSVPSYARLPKPLEWLRTRSRMAERDWEINGSLEFLIGRALVSPPVAVLEPGVS